MINVRTDVAEILFERAAAKGCITDTHFQSFYSACADTGLSIDSILSTPAAGVPAQPCSDLVRLLLANATGSEPQMAMATGIADIIAIGLRASLLRNGASFDYAAAITDRARRGETVVNSQAAAAPLDDDDDDDQRPPTTLIWGEDEAPPATRATQSGILGDIEKNRRARAAKVRSANEQTRQQQQRIQAAADQVLGLFDQLRAADVRFPPLWWQKNVQYPNCDLVRDAIPIPSSSVLLKGGNRPRIIFQFGKRGGLHVDIAPNADSAAGVTWHCSEAGDVHVREFTNIAVVRQWLVEMVARYEVIPDDKLEDPINVEPSETRTRVISLDDDTF